MFYLREATIDDAELIHHYILEMAIYEKLEDKVLATPEMVRQFIFEEGYAEVLIIMKENKAIGFVLYFFNYSTFEGRPGLYLEDIFIEEEYRGRGYGTKIFVELAKIAVEKNCTRFEWVCLNWNKPSIAFYEKMGAYPMSEWSTWRMDGDVLLNLAEMEI